jgi:hypothetical protein
MKNFPAAGTEGLLLVYPDMDTAVDTGRTNKFGHRIVECSGTKVVFRVYERTDCGLPVMVDGKAIFKDYEVRHHDLAIKLLDGQFYETENGNYIDYPEYEHKASNSGKTGS